MKNQTPNIKVKGTDEVVGCWKCKYANRINTLGYEVCEKCKAINFGTHGKYDRINNLGELEHKAIKL